MTEQGRKPIEDIVIGDKVLTHKRRWMPVTDIGNRQADTVILTGRVYSLECTPNHPIYSNEDPLGQESWTEAADMEGLFWASPFLTADNTVFFAWDMVLDVKEGRRNIPVYNFSVREDQSYVANDIVVHNCQNLSTCGNKQGLQGEKSSLFFEMIRVIKEMREATDNQFPRIVLWENVYHALHIHGGEDYQEIIKQFCSLAGTEVHVPRPEKWSNAGTIVGDAYSLAWRVLDAQYWGVSQRRRRIFLVFSFGAYGGGHNRAFEILCKP